MTDSEPTFAAQITDYCSLLGREKVTNVCEISDRTLRYWLSGTITPPKTTRAGAIMLLGCHVESLAQSLTGTAPTP